MLGRCEAAERVPSSFGVLRRRIYVDSHQGVGQHHPCIHRHPWYQHHAANAKHAGVAIRRLTSRCILRGWAATHLLVDMLGEPRPRCAASLWVAALVLPASVAIQQCCGDVDVLLGGLSAEPADSAKGGRSRERLWQRETMTVPLFLDAWLDFWCARR